MEEREVEICLLLGEGLLVFPTDIQPAFASPKRYVPEAIFGAFRPIIDWPMDILLQMPRS